MPISRILDDGRVEIYNSKTKEVKSVMPEELGQYNPAMIAEYEKMTAPDPVADLANLKATKEMELIKSGKAPQENLSESGTKFKTALVAASDALGSLESGLNTGPLATRLGQLGEVFGRTGKGTDYRSSLALANTALKSAFLGAAQSGAELKGIQDLIPKPTDQEDVARAKLEKSIEILNTMFPNFEGATQEVNVLDKEDEDLINKFKQLQNASN